MFWKQGLAYATCSEYLHFLVLASLLKLESPNCTPTLLAHHQCKILPFQVLTCKKRWNFLQNICFKRKAKEKLFLKCTIVNIFCKHHQLWTRRYVCWFIQLDCKKTKWSSFDLLHHLTFEITRQILDSPLNRVFGERNCGKLFSASLPSTTSAIFRTQNKMLVAVCCFFDKIHQKNPVSSFSVLYYAVRKSFCPYFWFADAHFLSVAWASLVSLSRWRVLYYKVHTVAFLPRLLWLMSNQTAYMTHHIFVFWNSCYLVLVVG